MAVPQRFYQVCVQESREHKTPIDTLGYYHDGNIQGLNTAFSFFAGTLDTKDCFGD